MTRPSISVLYRFWNPPILIRKKSPRNGASFWRTEGGASFWRTEGGASFWRTEGGASFWRAEGGATAIEYALIATLISVAILAALSLFADSMGAMFNTVSNAVSSGT